MRLLTEKYKPNHIADFIGLEGPRRLLTKLATEPRPMALLFVGPPGVGKTTMALALANDMNAALIHVPAQKCTVDTVEQVWNDVHYYPSEGKRYWLVLVDEADHMSRAAQLALLSHLDATAMLMLGFGGLGQCKKLPVMWVFTANGEGYNGVSIPKGLEARFVSRCVTVPFMAKSIAAALPEFIENVWCREGGEEQPDGVARAREIARQAGGCVRDALNKLEMALLDCTWDEVPEPLVEQTIHLPVAPIVPGALSPQRAQTPLEYLQAAGERFWATR